MPTTAPGSFLVVMVYIRLCGSIVVVRKSAISRDLWYDGVSSWQHSKISMGKAQ
jgi:hypothetical protein